MKDLLLRLEATTAIIKIDMPKKDKIKALFQTMSGLDLTNLNDDIKQYLYQYMHDANSITAKYPIKTFSDYDLISENHLNKLLKIISTLCRKIIQLQMKSGDNENQH